MKQKFLFLHDTFFSLSCVCIPQGHPDSYGSYLAYDSSKRKKYHKKEKHTLSKEILKFRNKNFHPAESDGHAVRGETEPSAHVSLNHAFGERLISRERNQTGTPCEVKPNPVPM